MADTNDGISRERARGIALELERDADKLIVKARQGMPNEIADQLGEAQGLRHAAYRVREEAGLLPQPDSVPRDWWS